MRHRRAQADLGRGGIGIDLLGAAEKAGRGLDVAQFKRGRPAPISALKSRGLLASTRM